jgi:hypothetical protein
MTNAMMDLRSLVEKRHQRPPVPTAALAGYDAAECARLNDLCRFGQLASARIVITRNCLEALSDPDTEISGFLARMHTSAKLRD